MNKWSRLLILTAVVLAAGAVGAKSGPDSGTNTLSFSLSAGSSNDFHFAIVSDRAGGVRPGVFESAVEKVNSLRPAFVMSVGDFIEGWMGDQVELSRQRDEFDRIAGGFKMPFVRVAGNHDVGDQLFLDDWVRRYGKPYSHFIYKDALFLCLDTEGDDIEWTGNMSDRQIGYFKDVLARYPEVRWTFIFMHRPMWLEADTNGKWMAFEKMLGDRKVTFFAGHCHTYSLFIRNGRKYFDLATTGGGSELLGPASGQFDHITWVTVGDGEPVVANLALDGILGENIRTLSESDVAGIQVRSGIMSARATPFFFDDELFTRSTGTVWLGNGGSRSVAYRATFPSTDELTVRPASAAGDLEPGERTNVHVILEAAQHSPAPADMAPLTAQVEFSVVPPGGTQAVSASIDIPIQPVRYWLCQPAEAPVCVDGDLGEWPGLRIGCSLRDSPGDDAALQFDTSHDEKNVYLAARVRDEHVVADSAKSWNEQDRLVVRLDARPDPERSNQTWGGEFEKFLVVGLVPGTTANDMQWIHRETLPQDIKAVCIKTGDGYVMELAVPVSYVNAMQGKGWDKFRLNLRLFDVDENGAEGATSLYWQPDWRGPANTIGSGTFKRTDRRLKERRRRGG